MTDLTPTPSFDPVPQLETSTLALGGPGQPMNAQAQALLNRTQFLNAKPFRLEISVTDAPFNASTVGNATAAFQAAYDAAPAGGRIIVPAPGPFTVGTVTGSKIVTWEVQYNIQTNLALLNLPGSVIGSINDAQSVFRRNGGANEFALQRFDRVANYAGGTPGNVCSGLHGYTNVSNNAAENFEWVATFVLDNAGKGQNVAVYGQGNRRAVSAVTIGGTFAGVFEARDHTQELNPNTGLIGLEVDVFANGTDNNNRRVIMDLVTGKGVAEGTAGEIGYGIRIGPTGGDTSNSSVKNAIYLYGSKGAGLVIAGTNTGRSIDISATGGTKGVVVTGSNTVCDFESGSTTNYGMIFTGTYASGIALRVNGAIGLENSDQIKIRHSGALIEFLNGATVKHSFNTGSGAFSINGTQVLGPRNTGWAAMTGAQNKGTIYDTSTITLVQLAERYNALQAAMTGHGAIGA